MMLPAERDRLAELEGVVERGLATFIEVGVALAEVRDGRLYRATHETFADYLRERWGISRSRGYRLIAAAEVATAVSPNGDIEPPSNEAQARALVPLRDDEAELRAVWRGLRAVHGDALTADLVTEEARRGLARREAKEYRKQRTAERAAGLAANSEARYPHAAVAAYKQPVDPDVERDIDERIKRTEAEIAVLKSRVKEIRSERHAYHKSLWDRPFACSGLFWEPGQTLGVRPSWRSEADEETGGLILRYFPGEAKVAPSGRAA